MADQQVLMSTHQQTRTAARRFLEEIWSQGNMTTVEEILAADFAFVLSFMRTDGLEAFKKLVHANRTAFADLTYSSAPGDIIVEGERAAAYWTMSGKHVGAWAGIEPTGRTVSIQGISFFHFTADGQIDLCRVQNDVRGLRQQLGSR